LSSTIVAGNDFGESGLGGEWDARKQQRNSKKRLGSLAIEYRPAPSRAASTILLLFDFI
jgi:hypothetical protein